MLFLYIFLNWFAQMLFRKKREKKRKKKKKEKLNI